MILFFYREEHCEVLYRYTTLNTRLTIQLCILQHIFTGSLYQFKTFTSLSINNRMTKNTSLAEMILMQFPFT